jgi:Uma2 family endonuclease
MKTLPVTKLPRSARRSRRGVFGAPSRSYDAPTVVRALKPKGEFWTDAELLALGERSDIKYELCDGKITAMPPAKPRHGMVISQMIYLLGCHVYEHKLGKIFEGQTGFRLSLKHCYEPDVSFVSNERMKLILTDDGLDGLFHAAPDLAVEVLSPSDSITKTERRMRLYLTYGAQLAWMIDPKHKTARVYRPNQDFELLRGDRFLTGNSVLPGFRVSLTKLFEGI